MGSVFGTERQKFKMAKSIKMRTERYQFEQRLNVLTDNMELHLGANLWLSRYLTFVDSRISGLHVPYLQCPRTIRRCSAGASLTATFLSRRLGRRWWCCCGRGQWLLLTIVIFGCMVCVKTFIGNKRCAVHGQYVIVANTYPRYGFIKYYFHLLNEDNVRGVRTAPLTGIS